MFFLATVDHQGRPMAEYVIARGHRVVGIDQSKELLAKARDRSPDQKWLHAALEDYPFAGEFQAAICWDALFHIDRRHHEGIIGRMADCLPAGGRLMLTIGGSEHPAFTDTMFGQEFFYDSFPPPQVLRMLDGLGLVVLVGEFMNERASGRDKGRYAIVAAKR